MNENLEVILNAPDDRYLSSVEKIFRNTFPEKDINLSLSKRGISKSLLKNPSMESPTGRAILRRVTSEKLYPHANYIVSIDKGGAKKYLLRDHLIIRVPSTSLILADIDHKNTFTLSVDWPFFRRRRVGKNLAFALNYLKQIQS